MPENLDDAKGQVKEKAGDVAEKIEELAEKLTEKAGELVGNRAGQGGVAGSSPVIVAPARSTRLPPWCRRGAERAASPRGVGASVTSRASSVTSVAMPPRPVVRSTLTPGRTSCRRSRSPVKIKIAQPLSCPRRARLPRMSSASKCRSMCSGTSWR